MADRGKRRRKNRSRNRGQVSLPTVDALLKAYNARKIGSNNEVPPDLLLVTVVCEQKRRWFGIPRGTDLSYFEERLIAALNQDTVTTEWRIERC